MFEYWLDAMYMAMDMMLASVSMACYVNNKRFEAYMKETYNQ